MTDSLGRQITVRELNALDKLRLFKAAGPELAQNEPWLGMAMLAISVSALEDVPVPTPVTEQQIETLIGRLGDAGLSAIADVVHEEWHQRPEEIIASAGNLHGTPT